MAVLGSSVRRPAAPYSSRGRSATRRRAVVGVLVLLSLALITGYFREPADGVLHDVQGAGASVLRPFQVAAERVARPFRDAYGYVDGLVDAKAENERLRAEIETLRRVAIANQAAARENTRLRNAFRLQDLPSLSAFRTVNTRVIGYPGRFERTLVVAAGSGTGLRVHDPVVSEGVLVGEVTAVTGSTAEVTLLTDETSSVSARDLDTGAPGLIRPGPGDSLVLDRVTKDRAVRPDDLIVTAGSRVGRLPSLFPAGIPIGLVTSVGQTDTEPFKQIQVSSYVDSDDLYAVTVLVRKRPLPEIP